MPLCPSASRLIRIRTAVLCSPPVVALAFLLFVLIYLPCIATIVAIKNEAGGWKWALFSAGYSLVLAWLVAFAGVPGIRMIQLQATSYKLRVAGSIPHGTCS